MKEIFNPQIDDEQRLELVKNFLSKEYKKIIVFVVLLAGSIFGWQYYENHQSNYNLQARAVFLKIVGSKEIANENYQILQQQYKDSIYTQMANLYMAKNAVEDEDIDGAINYLSLLTKDKTSDDFLFNVAKLRLAKVYLQTEQLEKAQNELIGINAEFTWQIELIKAEIASENGDIAKAREHYEKAIKETAAQPELASFIQLKLDDL